jgi:hypothetical protein
MADYFSFLNVCEIKNDAAIIYCEGVGTSTTHKQHNNTDLMTNFTYDIIDYDTRGMFTDSVELIRNIGILYGTRNLDDMNRIKRLESIVDIIISHADRSQIILLGISHGSILFHLALLRLKTRSDFVLTSDFMKKIIFVTVGSPHPPPGMLLHKYENDTVHFYNFYHKDDSVLTNPFLKWGLSKLASASNPFTSKYHKRTAVVPTNYKLYPINNPIIKYDTVKRICMIQHDLGEHFMGILSHASPMLAYPFFFKILYENGTKFYTLPIIDNIPRALYNKIINNIHTPEYAMMYAICNIGILSDLLKFGGGSVVARHKYLELKKTQKKYIVHVDRKINKPYIRVSNQRVFLCDIRNTYRYI